jgi:ketosteroid isomerase-like protein
MSEYANLEAVFADWLDAHRRGDIDALARRLHPDAVHQGVRPELICPDREAILEQARYRIGHGTPRVGRLELIAHEDRVLLGIAGPDLRGPDGDRPPNQMTYIVFTLRDGLIVRMDDYETRRVALDALGRRPHGDDLR